MGDRDKVYFYRVVWGAVALLVWTGSVWGQVSGLSGWSIVLDPGHSQRENQGAFGYSEAEKVVRIGLHLRDLLLETTDIDTVYLTRTNDQQQVSLSQRVDFANQTGAAYYHSIHSNAGAPSTNHLFVLWPQDQDGSEVQPSGGKRMADLMSAVLAAGMRVESRGGIGECEFYGVSSCRPPVTNQGKGGSRNFVQSFTEMASTLSEAGFHTNPRQNQLNMNADWKRLEAQGMYWGILEFHGVARPPVQIVTGTVFDIETGRPLNGANVIVGEQTYTTDSFESLFNQYSSDPERLRNGFYYLTDVPSGSNLVRAEAEGYRPFITNITPVDTFFTFLDLPLIPTVAPTVVNTTPEPDTDGFRIIDNVVLEFNRRMDRESTEQAFSITSSDGSEVSGSFVWSDRDFRLTFVPDSLQPLTTYTVTVDESAQGRFEDAFDGDGDGQPGGDFAFSFTTGFRDVLAPRILTSNPRVNDRDVELRPVLTLTYDERLDSTSVEGRVRLEQDATNAIVPGEVRVYTVNEQSILHFFPAEDLDPDARYVLIVDAGVSDRFGNADPAPKQLRFTTGIERFVTTRIDDFEQDAEANWWVPQQSGSTTGILTRETNFSVDTTIVNELTDSRLSMQLDYGWETGNSDWLIREFLNAGPPRDVTFEPSDLVQAYVFGDGSGTLFRFAVDDQVPDTDATHHEVSPWYTVDWLGWRLVTWDVAADGTGTWLGNGVPEGRLRIDSIQLSYEPGGAVTGTLYIDDLRFARRETVDTAHEPDTDLPTTVALEANYPNPFSSTTTIRFTLDEPAPVTVEIHDALGRRVATLLHDEWHPTGMHELQWQPGRLGSGTYFCTLRTGSFRQTRTMLYLP